MKKLWVVRHAKSSWNDNSLPDFKRPLNKRGFLSATFIGNVLKKKGVSPDIILSSPAVRAKTTAEIIAETIGGKTIEFNPDIYEAHYRNLVQIVNNLDGSLNSAMLFGHNPGLSDLTAYLTGEMCQLVTCSVVEINLEVEDWAACSKETGWIVQHDFPKNHAEFVDLIND